MTDTTQVDLSILENFIKEQKLKLKKEKEKLRRPASAVSVASSTDTIIVKSKPASSNVLAISTETKNVNSDDDLGFFDQMGTSVEKQKEKLQNEMSKELQEYLQLQKQNSHPRLKKIRSLTKDPNHNHKLQGNDLSLPIPISQRQERINKQQKLYREELEQQIAKRQLRKVSNDSIKTSVLKAPWDKDPTHKPTTVKMVKNEVISEESEPVKQPVFPGQIPVQNFQRQNTNVSQYQPGLPNPYGQYQYAPPVQAPQPFTNFQPQAQILQPAPISIFDQPPQFNNFQQSYQLPPQNYSTLTQNNPATQVQHIPVNKPAEEVQQNAYAGTHRQPPGGFSSLSNRQTNKSSYKEELERQIAEDKARKEQAKKAANDYDLKVEKQAEIYDPFGKGGAGAPIKTVSGNIVTDLRKLRAHNELNSNDPTSLHAIPEEPDKKNFTYKDYLEEQINEKKRKAELKKKQEEEEEIREEKRFQRQQMVIKAELEREQEQAKKKIEEKEREQKEKFQSIEDTRIQAENLKKAEFARKREQGKAEIAARKTQVVEISKEETPQSDKDEEVHLASQQTFKVEEQAYENNFGYSHKNPPPVAPNRYLNRRPIESRDSMLDLQTKRKDVGFQLRELKTELQNEKYRVEQQLENRPRFHLRSQQTYRLPKREDSFEKYAKEQHNYSIFGLSGAPKFSNRPNFLKVGTKTSLLDARTDFLPIDDGGSDIMVLPGGKNFEKTPKNELDELLSDIDDRCSITTAQINELADRNKERVERLRQWKNEQNLNSRPQTKDQTPDEIIDKFKQKLEQEQLKLSRPASKRSRPSSQANNGPKTSRQATKLDETITVSRD